MCNRVRNLRIGKYAPDYLCVIFMSNDCQVLLQNVSHLNESLTYVDLAFVHTHFHIQSNNTYYHVTFDQS